jgi:hypothetical protein
MSELAQKLAPGSSLANFQEQLKVLGQQLGQNGTFITATTTNICCKHC